MDTKNLGEFLENLVQSYLEATNEDKKEEKKPTQKRKKNEQK